MTAAQWLALVLSNLYCLGLGACGCAVAVAIHSRPEGWEWVPDGLLAGQGTMRRRAATLVALWPLSLVAMYLVGQELGMADRGLKRAAIACFLLDIAAGLAVMQIVVLPAVGVHR